MNRDKSNDCQHFKLNTVRGLRVPVYCKRKATVTCEWMGGTFRMCKQHAEEGERANAKP
jgi:hypothetical protein